MKKKTKSFICIRNVAIETWGLIDWIVLRGNRRIHSTEFQYDSEKWLVRERRKKIREEIRRRRKAVRRRLDGHLVRENHRKSRETFSVMVRLKMPICFVTMFRFVSTLFTRIYLILCVLVLTGCVESAWFSMARRQDQGQKEAKVGMQRAITKFTHNHFCSNNFPKIQINIYNGWHIYEIKFIVNRNGFTFEDICALRAYFQFYLQRIMQFPNAWKWTFESCN